MKTVEQKIIEAKRMFKYVRGTDPDCVIIDRRDEASLDPSIFNPSDLTVMGMHLVLCEDMPHGAVRCGMMR